MNRNGLSDRKQCNLAVPEQLTGILEDIEREAGQIDCIVNFTGDADAVTHWKNPEAYLIRTQNAQQIAEAMTVRHQTAEEISRFVSTRKQTHVFLLSSITAMFGGYSFGVYSAVSSELFYAYAGNPQYTVIASSKWHDIGMSNGEPEENYLLSERLGFDTLRPGKGISYLVKLFSAKPGSILYGLNDFNYQILKSVNVRTGSSGYVVKEITQKQAYRSDVLTEQVLQLWQEIMKNKNISPDDRFFDIGGNSITSVQLIHRIKALFEAEISIPELFENPSVRQLAGMIAEKKGISSTVPDHNETEAKMLAIWKQALKLETIAAEDKFFDVGGNSLKSIHLISKVNEAFGTELTVVDLFEHPTVLQLSAYITELGAATVPATETETATGTTVFNL